MFETPLVKRRRLKKVVDRIRHAIQAKARTGQAEFTERDERYMVWMKRIHVAEFMIERNVLSAVAEIDRLKTRLESEGVMTRQEVQRFGNGHRKSCRCPECIGPATLQVPAFAQPS